MIVAALLMLAQAAPPPAVPQSFSVLARDCPPTKDDPDVVVCADGTTGPRLPLPDEREPDGPVAVNPKLDGAGALAAEATPCGATQKGCTVGVGPPIMPIVQAATGLVKSAFARKPDKRGRVAIDLATPTPATAGHVHP